MESNVSTTSNQQRIVPTKIKVELDCETIHILSDDSDSDTQCLPQLHNRVSIPSFDNLDSPLSIEDRQPLCAKPPLPPSSSSLFTIVDCIRKLDARKGSKSILSRVELSNF